MTKQEALKNMKELGYVRTFFSTDKLNWIEKTGLFHLRIHYHEPFQDLVEEIRYEDVENEWSFWLHKPWLLNKKEYKEYSWFHNDNSFRIYPDQVLYVKRIWDKLDGCVSFDYLSRDMDVDEFIQYIKDNGLNVCPIK